MTQLLELKIDDTGRPVHMEDRSALRHNATVITALVQSIVESEDHMPPDVQVTYANILYGIAREIETNVERPAATWRDDGRTDEDPNNTH